MFWPCGPIFSALRLFYIQMLFPLVCINFELWILNLSQFCIQLIFQILHQFRHDLIDYDVEDEYEQDDEEGTITIYGDPKSYAAIQKHLEECGFEDVGGDFTYIPNDLKEVTPEQRETLDKMIERLEEFDDVQTVYTNMKPEEGGNEE